MSDASQAMGPDEFQHRVEAAGGRVDFVFEDDRPFASCHASTVVEAEDGGLLCAYFAGAGEGDPDVGIWLSKLEGGNWSAPALAAKVGQVSHYNPVLFRDPSRGTFLFFKVGVNCSIWKTWWTRSEDSGLTWSEPVELVPGDEGGRGPVKNKPIILADGAWLAPGSTELGRWKLFADRSEDGGQTWVRSEDFDDAVVGIAGDGAIQPTFWESAPGVVHSLARTSGGFIARSDSQDSGRSWSPLVNTGLPNNNSGLDSVRLDDGRVLLIYNPVDKDWGPRTPLNLAVSTDNGESWTDIASLETAEGEYSYPSMVSTSKGVAISYTWRRERTRCWLIPTAVL